MFQNIWLGLEKYTLVAVPITLTQRCPTQHHVVHVNESSYFTISGEIKMNECMLITRCPYTALNKSMGNMIFYH